MKNFSFPFFFFLLLPSLTSVWEQLYNPGPEAKYANKPWEMSPGSDEGVKSGWIYWWGQLGVATPSSH